MPAAAKPTGVATTLKPAYSTAPAAPSASHGAAAPTSDPGYATFAPLPKVLYDDPKAFGQKPI
ncbi:hypothetical protein AB0B51_34350, partial [Streptomyces griseus]|uniref:hypothetical protein n=1 Tax=Streptomyces griseus TaxID=1911 RepID=UPI00349648E9